MLITSRVETFLSKNNEVFLGSPQGAENDDNPYENCGLQGAH